MLGAALSLLTPAVALFTGCGNDNKPDEMTVPAVDVVVGAMLPVTGPNANADWITAVGLAVTDVNAAIKKAKMAKPINFTLNKIDTASNEAMAFAAMQTYVDAGAKVVISEASNAAIGANRFNYTGTNAGKELPVISFTATSGSLNKMAPATDMVPEHAAALTDAGNWFYRTCPASDALSALRLAQVFGEGADVNGDGKIKVVWIGSNDTSTVASINGDKTAFQNYVNLPANAALVDKYIAEVVTFDPGATPETFNYGPAITLATDAFLNDGMVTATTADYKPDLIINKALSTIAIPFIKAYKQNPLNNIAIFQDGSFRRNTLLAALGSTADGQRGVSNIAYEASVGGEVFKAEQQAKTLYPPAAYEAQAYDAAVLAMLAVVKASITKDDIATVTGADVKVALNDLNHFDLVAEPTSVKFYTGADELAKGIAAMGTKPVALPVDYSGASGNNNFDAVGNVFDRAVLWTITGGQFVEQSYFDCGPSGTCAKLDSRTSFGTIQL